MLEALLVVATVIVTLAISSFFRKGGSVEGFVVPEAVEEKLAQITADAEAAQEEIKDATNDDKPEEKLAELGNRRRR